MTIFRVFLLVIALLFFFIVGAPLQWMLARRSPWLATRLALAFCRTLLRILRVSVDVAGVPERHGPVLLAVNHVSWIDILALGSIMPFCFLAKREVASWPILSAFAKVQGTVFVDRARRRGIPPANRQMADRMLEGRVVLLFPEGTTYDGESPGRFHSSHFAAARDLLRDAPTQVAVSVQPVALAYSSPAAAWVGDDGLLPHLWRILRGAPLRCLVAFGPALAYRGDTDRKAVARQSRAAIIAMLAAARAERPLYAWPNRRPAQGSARTKMTLTTALADPQMGHPARKGALTFTVKTAKAPADKPARIKPLLQTYGNAIAKSREAGRPVSFRVDVAPNGEAKMTPIEEAVIEQVTFPVEKTHERSPELEAALVAARERGSIRAAAILSGDDMLSAEALAQRLGISRMTVNTKRRNKQLLALDGAKRGFRFPVWQLDAEDKPRPELPELHERLGGPWAVYRFLVQRHGELDGLTGREALVRGMGEAVLCAAASVGRGDFR